MIRNLLLAGMAFSVGIEMASAQKALRLKTTDLVAVPAFGQHNDVYKGAEQTAPPTAKGNTKNSKIGAWAGSTQIGKSYYDLQSNSSTGNRLLRHPDGTLSAVWTEHCTPGGTTYNDRGIGYNYFNGTTWIEGADGTCDEPGAAFGVSNQRTGWPEIMLLGNNREAIISHSLNNGLTWDIRPAKGTKGLASWAPTILLPHTQNINGGSGNNGTWPRAVSKGDTIHTIYAVNHSASTATNPIPVINGIANPMVYSRSFDGGQTWNKQNIFLPGMQGVTSDVSTQNSESFKRIGGDDYAIAVKGSTVAIVAGSMGEPWTLWKSTDNGNTFTRRVIKAVGPQDTIHLANTARDTAAFVNDGNHAVLIDNNNNVHVWAGVILAKVNVKTQTGSPGNKYFLPTHTWFPHAASSMWYWNDTKPVGAAPDSIADVDLVPYPGVNFPGIALDPDKRAPYGSTGIISMPNASLAQNGDIYMVYSSVVRGYSNDLSSTGQPFRDLYIMKRRVSDGVWSAPINLSVALNAFTGGTPGPENFEESVFPTVPRTIGADNILHLMWMSDTEPGMALGDDEDTETENEMSYYPVNVNTLPFVFPIRNITDDFSAYINQVSAYPNPTTGDATILVDMKKPSDVKVKVTNLMGQEIVASKPTKMAVGSNAIKLDMTGFAKGVYFYTIMSDNFTTTKRIVKQ